MSQTLYYVDYGNSKCINFVLKDRLSQGLDHIV